MSLNLFSFFYKHHQSGNYLIFQDEIWARESPQLKKILEENND